MFAAQGSVFGNTNPPSTACDSVRKCSRRGMDASRPAEIETGPSAISKPATARRLRSLADRFSTGCSCRILLKNSLPPDVAYELSKHWPIYAPLRAIEPRLLFEFIQTSRRSRFPFAEIPGRRVFQQNRRIAAIRRNENILADVSVSGHRSSPMDCRSSSYLQSIRSINLVGGWCLSQMLDRRA